MAAVTLQADVGIVDHYIGFQVNQAENGRMRETFRPEYIEGGKYEFIIKDI